MDETNKDILRLLSHDGRMSFTEIGEQLGISRVAVMKRVKKLEEEGIIHGYKAIIHQDDTIKMLLEIYAVDDDYEVSELKYLTKMVRKKFADKIKRIEAHGVKEIIKDILGGVDYDRAGRERNKGNEQVP